MTKLPLQLLFTFLFTVAFLQAQEIENPYKPEREKINDLVHTKLKVRFDFKKQQMPAEAWITAKPHFYATQTLVLDAKAMQIDKVSREGKELKYDYDGKKLNIKLGNTFVKDEEYTIYIKYIAKPEEVKSEGSAAITDEKGLYFIDPEGTNPERPTEIWTQGETESSSVWFPTIDAPNQKTTEEIYMTVPSKYVTLSNGVLESQTENSDGTRTDYWKMDQKHAPYLFFMGVGDFSIVKDTYKGKPVNYYVDKEYEPYAKEIFGLTPEMMQFFSDFTGVEYVWSKYDQMVAYDYVSGAMENTTAVLHADNAYQTSGQLIDKNTWEPVIAHELFHHWFGDLVTTESWSNLTVNESFANYSEYLWFEYKYGKDAADAHRHEDLQGYFSGKNKDKKLVRFHYAKHMDMFDGVSYNKGGGILHMLRNYLGDNAFKAGLKEYLTANKFGTGEAHQLRLALEKVSGKDLNEFFNQWYFGSGHPELKLTYGYDENTHKASIKVEQGEKLFSFPVKINVYENEKPKTYTLWVSKKDETFAFEANTAPKLIDFDIEKTLVAVVEDNKTVANYIFQYKNAPSYENRREALEKLAAHKDNKAAAAVLREALNDPYYELRIMALNKLDLTAKNTKPAIAKVKSLITNDPKTLVQAAAIKAFAKIAGKKEISLFDKASQSKSYSVKGSAITALYELDKAKAIAIAKTVSNTHDKKGMKDALIAVYIKEKDESQFPFIAKNIIAGMFFTKSEEKQKLYGEAFKMLAASDNLEATKNLVKDFVSKGKQFKKYGADKIISQLLQQVLAARQGSTSADKEEMVALVQNAIKELE